MTIDDIKTRICELSNKQDLLTEQEESDLYEIKDIINGYREEAFSDYVDALQYRGSYQIIERERRYDSICDISNEIEKVQERQFKLKYPELCHY